MFKTIPNFQSQNSFEASIQLEFVGDSLLDSKSKVAGFRGNSPLLTPMPARQIRPAMPTWRQVAKQTELLLLAVYIPIIPTLVASGTSAGPDFIVCVDVDGCIFRYDSKTPGFSGWSPAHPGGRYSSGQEGEPQNSPLSWSR